MNLHYGYIKDGHMHTLPKCLVVPLSEDRYTDDPDKVTCKICLRILNKLWAEAEAKTQEDNTA